MHMSFQSIARESIVSAGLAFAVASPAMGAASEKLGTVGDLMANGYTVASGSGGPITSRDSQSETSFPVRVGDETYIEGKLFLQKGETLAYCIFDIIIDTRKDSKHEPMSACWRVK